MRCPCAGAAVLGNPLNGIVWMANELSRQSIGLKRGHIVPIGTWTGLHFVARGTKVNADFGEMGTVDFRIRIRPELGALRFTKTTAKSSLGFAHEVARELFGYIYQCLNSSI
jgi:hypothetical protein